MTINEVLKEAVEILKNNKIENPHLHARILLGHILKKDKIYLITNNNEDINEDDKERFMVEIKKLANRRANSIYNKLSGIYDA